MTSNSEEEMDSQAILQILVGIVDWCTHFENTLVSVPKGEYSCML